MVSRVRAQPTRRRCGWKSECRGTTWHRNPRERGRASQIAIRPDDRRLTFAFWIAILRQLSRTHSGHPKSNRNVIWILVWLSNYARAIVFVSLDHTGSGVSCSTKRKTPSAHALAAAYELQSFKGQGHAQHHAPRKKFFLWVATESSGLTILLPLV